MDGNAKHDLEHSSEKAVNVSAKGGKVISKLLTKFLLWVNKKYQKHFSSSMKALKKDGATKELSVSPPLTKAEAKELIAKARENDILLGVKKMQPDGEVGKNKSLNQQEKMAKNEIKYNKWNERRNTFKKIPFINHLCESKTNKFKRLALEDNAKNKEERYVVICNKSRRPFLTEQLEMLSKKRVEKMASNELEDINKDGVIDPNDYELKSRDINMMPEDLNKIGEDYGSCMVVDYHNNYCTQKISKLEYCEIREQLFELKSHGACVLNDNEVLIAISSDDLEEYKKFAPLDKTIKEFGEGGAKKIEAVSNMNNIIHLQMGNDKEFAVFKQKYKGKDFLAQHNPDGTINVMVREEDTKAMVDDAKKKSSTADLLKEANEFAKEQNTPEIEHELELDEGIEVAR